MEIAFEIDADAAVDVLVTDLDGAQRRHTTHRGRISMFELDPGLFRWSGTGITAERSLWLPDGLAYRERPHFVSADVTVAQHHVPLHGGHQSGLVGWGASAEPDPRGTGLWFVQLWLSAFVDTRPALFTYRVDVIADPDSIERSARGDRQGS